MDKRQYPEVNTMSAFLCLCVIAIHLTATPISQLTVGSIPHTGLFLINRALAFSVPGFLFLSGFKLYSRYGSGELDVKAFYRKRLRGVLLPYFAAVLVYFIYYYAKGWVSVSKLPEYLLLGTLVSHFYYIVIAAQFYLLFPVLKAALNRFPLLTVGISILSTLTFYKFVYFPYSDRFAGTYLLFFVLGMVLRKYDLSAFFLRHAGVFIGAPVLIGIFHTWSLYGCTYGQKTYPLVYPVTIAYFSMAACGIFTLCSMGKQRPFFQKLSRISFPVYLYHMLPILVLQYDLFPRFALTPKEQFLISCTVVYGPVFAWAAISGKEKKIA